jgi:hypothetical protein
MKSLSTLLAAALVAGSCTVAMAQAGGGASGGDQSQQGTMKDADKNPTGAANPTAGNTAAPAGQSGQSGMSGQSSQGSMTTAPASNTRSDNPARPAGTKDSTGGSTGGGAVK